MGRAGGVLTMVGVVTFFAGLFGAPRTLVFIGITLIVLSLVAYFLEEFGQRKAADARRA